ncbi:MAG: hypothetical protein J6U37_05945 [Lachnospiraceae bacterium]|nr:hypothetical protein [Lachnospiraceae bacterium]
MAKEYYSEYESTKEYCVPSDEFPKNPYIAEAEPIAASEHEYVPPKETEEAPRRKKRGNIFLQAAAAMIMVVAVLDAFGIDILHNNPLGDYIYKEIETVYPDAEEVLLYTDPEPEPPKRALDEADTAFPILSNLDPNGYVPGYGILDEEFVRLENADGSVDYLYCTDGVWNRGSWWIDEEGLHLTEDYATQDYYYDPNITDPSEIPEEYLSGAHWIIDENGFIWYRDPELVGGYEPLRKNLPIGPVEGAYYDEFTNTLTLSNFTGHFLNVNLMGNGFKIKLVGKNKLTGLVGWGFMYGGSITLTGDGSLDINNPSGFGILLQAEDSESCLMIDKNVSLHVQGSEGAILIKDSKLNKGIYYLNPLVMESKGDPEVFRSWTPIGSFKLENSYSISDPDGQLLKEVSFTAKED